MASSAGLLLAYVALATALRWEPIAAGFAFADDWGHWPLHHLESARPLQALELWLGQNLLTPDYLISAHPRILAVLWWSLIGACLYAFLRRHGSPRTAAMAWPIVALAHPALNELILWGVLSGASLGLLLGVASTLLLVSSTGRLPRRIAQAGIALSGLGYQPNASVPIALVILDRMGNPSRPPNHKAPFHRDVGSALLAPALGLASAVFFRHILGLRDFAARGLDFRPGEADWWHAKFKVTTNLFANLYQAPVGWFTGIEAAQSAFAVALALPPILLFGVAIAEGRTWRDTAAAASAPLVVIGFAAAPLLVTSATPSGWRLMGPLVLLSCTALGVFGPRLSGNGQIRHWPALIPLALAALLAFPTVTDGALRTVAARDDARRVREIASFMTTSHGAATVVVCPELYGVPAALHRPRRPVVVTYRGIVSDDYSSFTRPAVIGYLGHHHIVATPGTDLSWPAPGSDLATWGDATLPITLSGGGGSFRLCRRSTVGPAR